MTMPHPLHVWRLWCNGREFGIDFPSLQAARKTKLEFQRHFPRARYYISRAHATP
jgi:hypothetical protein